jgi:hypothetical protein
VSEREFVVAYDYRMGGLWGFNRAPSEAVILQTLPELKVVHQRPPWMTREQELNVRATSGFTVAEPSTYPDWLRALVAERDAS